MGDASLAVKGDTKQRLDDHYRSSEYPSQDELIDGMMDALPSQEQIEQGCDQCGKRFRTTRYEELNAVTFLFYSEEHNHQDVKVFCSDSCLKEHRDEARSYTPRHPNKVVVGGKDELRGVLGDAVFVIDGPTMEVGIDVPAAFSGTDSHGTEYDYVGEPVFIQNDEEEWVQSGIVTDIINEEAHTGLIFEPALSKKVKPHHPDEEVRKDFKENSVVCPECGHRQLHYQDVPFDCPECGTPMPQHADDGEESDDDADDDQ